MELKSRDKFVFANYKHNFLVNTLDGGFFGFAMGFASFSTIVTLFVAKFSNSAILIGLIPAIHSMGWQLPQLLTAQRISQATQEPLLVRLNVTDIADVDGKNLHGARVDHDIEGEGVDSDIFSKLVALAVNKNGEVEVVRANPRLQFGPRWRCAGGTLDSDLDYRNAMFGLPCGDFSQAVGFALAVGAPHEDSDDVEKIVLEPIRVVIFGHGHPHGRVHGGRRTHAFEGEIGKNLAHLATDVRGRIGWAIQIRSPIEHSSIGHGIGRITLRRGPVRSAV